MAGGALVLSLLTVPAAADNATADPGGGGDDRLAAIEAALESSGYVLGVDENGNVIADDSSLSRGADSGDAPAVLLVTEESAQEGSGDGGAWQVGQQSDDTLIVLPDVPVDDALDAIADWTSDESIAEGASEAGALASCNNSFVALGSGNWSQPLHSCGSAYGQGGKVGYRYNVHDYVSYGACFQLMGLSINRHGLVEETYSTGGCVNPSLLWTFSSRPWVVNTVGVPKVKVKNLTVPFGSSGTWQSPVIL